MSTQFQVLSQECLKAVCLEKNDIRFFVSSNSLKKIRDWCAVMFVRWTEKEKVWEGEENSAEGTKLVHLETEDRHGFPVPSSCLHPAGKSSSPHGEADFLGER